MKMKLVKLSCCVLVIMLIGTSQVHARRKKVEPVKLTIEGKVLE